MEKLSRRHLINSSDVFVIKGFTVLFDKSYMNVITVIPEQITGLTQCCSRVH